MANLHLVTGYAGAAHVAAADQGSLHVAIFGEGNYVLNRGSKFGITVISNNTVRILDGDIMMQGRHIRLDKNIYVDLTIENGESGKNRNDLIVCRYTKNSGTGIEEADLIVIKGESVTSSPNDPAYIEADIINDSVMTADFPLYRIPISGLNVGTPVCLFGRPMETFDDHKNDDSIHTTVNDYTVSVPLSWQNHGSNGGYRQTINVGAMRSTDNPIYDVVLGEDVAANAMYINAFNCVTRLTTDNGSITLWANNEKPTSAFTLRLQVMR